jgi:signal transduction histidine kinase
MPSLDILIVTISVCVNAGLAVVVVRAHTKDRSTWLFLGMVALVIFWTIANYAIDASTTPGTALLWTRILFALALGYITLFFLFARSFSTIPPMRIPFLATGVSVLAFVVVVITLSTNLVFSDAATGTHGLETLVFGLWYLPFSLASLSIVALALAELVHKARRAQTKKVRDQVVPIIGGWVIFLSAVIVLGAVLPYFVPALVNGSKIVPLFSIVMVGSTTYSIVRYRFLDTTLLIRRGIVYSLLIGTVLGFYLTLLLAFDGFFEVESPEGGFLSGAITVILGLWTTPRIERFFRKHTDRFFFKDGYEYSVALEELGKTLNGTLRMPRLIRESVRSLSTILKSERIIFVRKTTGSQYGTDGILSGIQESFPADGYVVPVHAGGRLLGEFLLWPKRSGDPYTTEDRALLRTFASQAGVALEKATLYERLRQHSHSLEDTVRKRTAHLEVLRAEQRELMDDISHALQTPLTVLKSAVEKSTDDVEAVRVRYQELSLRSIDELSRMIRGLLSLARVDSVPFESAHTPFDMSGVIVRLVEYVQIVCESKDIVFVTDIAPRIPMHGSQAQIEEAVTNILSNAVRYTEKAPVRRITLRLCKHAEWITITIEDTGEGIAVEKLPHVFERFYRAQSEQGSGLGLAITKRIVERHQGRIEIESVLGKGAVVTIRFPLAGVSTVAKATD